MVVLRCTIMHIAALVSGSVLSYVGTIIKVIFCFHRQFPRAALTAEQGSDTPSVLRVHRLSLKHTLGRGQSQQGHVHQSPDIVILHFTRCDFSMSGR